MNRKPTFFRRTLAVALMIAVGSFQLLLTTSATAQTVQSGQFLSGELSVTGDVTINGVKAMPGDTVMNNTIIKTGCSGTAAVNIGQLGRIELGPGSEMTMNLSPEAIGGSLSAGSATISTPAGVAFSVVTPDGVVTSAGKDVAVITVDLTLGNTRVMSRRSDARITAGSKVEYVASGQEAAIGTQNPGRATGCGQLGAGGGVPTNGGGVPTGLSGGALAALIIAGVGGELAGIIAASNGGGVSPGSIFVSNFTP